MAEKRHADFIDNPNLVGLLGDFEEMAKPYTSLIKWKRFQGWVGSIFHFKEALERRKNATLLEAIKEYALCTCAMFLAFGAVFTGMLCGIGIIYAVLALIMLPFYLVFMFLLLFAGAVTTHISAKLLGGKGSLERFFINSIVLYCAFTTLYILGMLPGIIPVLGLFYLMVFGYLIMYGALGYFAYLYYYTIRTTYNLSTKRAAFLVVSQVFSIFFLFILCYFVMIAISILSNH